MDGSANFCPDCGGKSFSSVETPKVVDNSNNTLVHRLFYWNYEGHYVISKSKLIGISTFLLLFLSFMSS